MTDTSKLKHECPDTAQIRTTAAETETWLAHYISSARLLSKNAKLYLLGAFLFGITHANFQLLFNLYLREGGAAETTIGDVLAWIARGSALLALPAGFLLMRVRLKPVLIFSVLFYSAAVFMLSSWDDLSWLWPFAMVAGMSITFFRISGAPFYMRNSTPKERPLLFALGFGMMSLAGGLGSLGAGYLVTFLNAQTGDLVLAHRYALYVGISIGALAVIPFSLIKSKRPSAEESRQRLKLSEILQRMPLYLRVFIPYFLLGSGAGLIIPFLNIYFRDRFGQSAGEIGLYFFGVQIAMFLGTLAAPAFVRKIGRVRTIVLTELLSIPFMLVLAYTDQLGLAVAAFLLRGAFMNLGQPVATNFSMEIVSEREQGLLNSLMHLAWTGSWALSTSFGGALIEKHGYELPFYLTIGLYILSASLYYLFFHGYEEKKGHVFVINNGVNK